MIKKFTVHKLEELSKVSKEIIHLFSEYKIFIFEGVMGSGKTTLIKSICENIGVLENVNSPTFSIVNEYTTKNGKTIYHFDCYRINKIEEAIDMGTEEYLYSGNICFIEWSENISSLLPDRLVKLFITETNNGKREIEIIYE